MRIPPNKVLGFLKDKKAPLRICLGVVVLLIIGLLGIQEYIAYKVKTGISENLSKGIVVSYEDIDINILFGTVTVMKPAIEIDPSDSTANNIYFDARVLKFNGLQFWNLWSKREFEVDQIIVDKSYLKLTSKNSGHTKLFISNMNLELKNVKSDTQQLKQKIPFIFEGLSVVLDSIYTPISSYENMILNNLSLKDGFLETGEILILSNYSKSEIANTLDYERDHIVLTIDNGSGENFGIRTVNDSIKITSEKLVFLNVDVNLYRSKLIAENVIEKQLFGAMLKGLPIKLDMKSVLLDQGRISYTERVEEDVKPSSISFEGLHAVIENLSNSNAKKTEVKATAHLMGKAPIALNFSFQVQDPNQRFTASSTLTNLDADVINPFLVSNAKVKASGHIEELYLTVSGNNIKSTGDMKMKYKDFQFSVLDDDRLGINKTLTTVVNLFTNDGSKSDADGFRHGEVEVERDKTKSFFYYLWINAKDGLKNTVTGNGRKKD